MQRLCWCAAVALWLGCSSGDLQPPTVNPTAAAKAAMADFDADKNGRLDEAELLKAPGLKASAAQKMDENSDGLLSESEIAARVKHIVGEDIAMLQFACYVKLDGRPLEGAVVTATPEKFMGSQFKPAKGTSAKDGRVDLAMGEDGNPGMQCGIFRVEISKKDASGQETLPAKYNRETTLGMEIAQDLPTTERGMVFDLTSQSESAKK